MDTLACPWFSCICVVIELSCITQQAFLHQCGPSNSVLSYSQRGFFPHNTLKIGNSWGTLFNPLKGLLSPDLWRVILIPGYQTANQEGWEREGGGRRCYSKEGSRSWKQSRRTPKKKSKWQAICSGPCHPPNAGKAQRLYGAYYTAGQSLGSCLRFPGREWLISVHFLISSSYYMHILLFYSTEKYIMLEEGAGKIKCVGEKGIKISILT